MIQRILFTESSPNLGGQELQLLQQMSELTAHGVAVHLLCRGNSRIGGLARTRGLPTTAVPFRNSLHLPSIAAVARVVRSWQPDAVICHSGHDANTCAFAVRIVKLMHRKRQQPCLIRMRTYQAGVPHAWTYNLFSDLTFVPSAEMRRQLLANPRIRPGRIRVLYPGFLFEQIERDAATILPPPLATWLNQHPGPLLVHAAMLRAEKGHDVLLAALAQLVKKFPSLRYVIAGEGERRDELTRAIATQGLGEHVYLAGLVPHTAALYRRATLVVQPSLYEPLGMSQSEALSLGIPVVASRTGGIPETITHTHTGLLATPGDGNAWVSALDWALEHPEDMQQMALRGRDFVRSQFPMAKNIKQLLTAISTLTSLDK
jgi:glycosyltransferase involved in cell wall biosynthesis